MELLLNETKGKNVIYKDWGTRLQTKEQKNYKIKKVFIFKNGIVKVIANYFIDNFTDYKTEINGDIINKNKIDLNCKSNFIVKTSSPDVWETESEKDLYINGNLNDYSFEGLKLKGEQLDLNYKINNINCSQCIGWNHKQTYLIKYHEYEELYKKITCYNIDDSSFENNLKELNALYKKYKKAQETEKKYTEMDYKKMSLASGTTEEENKTMLKNNGLDI